MLLALPEMEGFGDGSSMSIALSAAIGRSMTGLGATFIAGRRTSGVLVEDQDVCFAFFPTSPVSSSSMSPLTICLALATCTGYEASMTLKLSLVTILR